MPPENNAAGCWHLRALGRGSSISGLLGPKTRHSQIGHRTAMALGDHSGDASHSCIVFVACKRVAEQQFGTYGVQRRERSWGEEKKGIFITGHKSIIPLN